MKKFLNFKIKALKNCLKIENLKLKIILAILFILVLPKFASATAPTNDLVGYWSFNEGSGTKATDLVI
jgi:hypothetical protein